MKKHNLPYSNKARQIKKDDFKKFDYIFGMDTENISELKDMEPKDGTAKILMLGDFDSEEDRIIRDPYYVSLKWKVNIGMQFNSNTFYRTMVLRALKNVMINAFAAVTLSWRKWLPRRFKLSWTELKGMGF